MSKKKNTLKDLDEFLKQQAASLVSPDKLNQKIEEPEPAETSRPAMTPPMEISSETILRDLKALHKKEGPSFKKNLYDIIIRSLEDDHTSPEDKMLINTALYLKGGDNWKDVIRTYWKNK